MAPAVLVPVNELGTPRSAVVPSLQLDRLSAAALAAVLPLVLRIALATFGVIAGTWLGGMRLGHLPERLFERVVSGLILAIGALLFGQRPGRDRDPGRPVPT